jgi:hypothetical protein
MNSAVLGSPARHVVKKQTFLAFVRCASYICFFFSLIVIGGTEVPIVYIFLCRPSEDSLQRSAIPDGSPSQDSSPL